VLVLNGSTVASFGDAEAPPPNAVAIAAKTAGSPQTTFWLLLLFGVLVVVLVIVYLWQRSRRDRESDVARAPVKT
jgi:nitrate/nitrite transporter NarK